MKVATEIVNRKKFEFGVNERMYTVLIYGWWKVNNRKMAETGEMIEVELSISAPVKQLCKKHNFPYMSFSFIEVNVTTLKTLKTAAMQARGLLTVAHK